ncbi:DUF202 domain-containing protein [Vibrio mediterranei]|jgi:uncharacterized membrane protein YidH (DUF202 family)|uniref:DUF202 domain-containing protein n=1 Tax=Vibrio mediterranei TaxID=689 RepID=UPI0039906B28
MMRDKGLQPERTAMSWLRTQLVLFGASLLLFRTYITHDYTYLALLSFIGIAITFVFSRYIQRRFEKPFTNPNTTSPIDYQVKIWLSVTVSILAFSYALYSLVHHWKTL